MQHLNNTLYRIPRRPGVETLQRRGDGARELSSWRLLATAGERLDFSVAGEETFVVLQQGRGTFRVGEDSWPVSRRGVFEEPATALYLPPGAALEVSAESDLEAIAISTPIDAAKSPPTLIPPSEVEIVERGRDGYRRQVHNISVDDDLARRLLIGETFNPPGHWSSFPPHKHDGRDGEPYLEEVYHYRVDPPSGFGQQLLYTADGESVAHTVRDGDAVLLPYGYHPVAAPPGYQLCYLWVLAGDERRLAVYEDPAHRWIHDLDS